MNHAAACPRCGHVREADTGAPEWQCPACGIAYAKFRPPGGDAPAEQGTGASGFERRAPMSFDTANLIAGAACAVLLLIKGMTGGVDMVNALLLIPFFLCLVPVISATFGDGLYMWNRWKMRFEPYDADAHPVLAKLLYAFCIVFSMVFLAFFFLLN